MFHFRLNDFDFDFRLFVLANRTLLPANKKLCVMGMNDLLVTVSCHHCRAAGISDNHTEQQRQQPSHRALWVLRHKYLTSAGTVRARAPPELPSETETQHKREAAD